MGESADETLASKQTESLSNSQSYIPDTLEMFANLEARPAKPTGWFFKGGKTTKWN